MKERNDIKGIYRHKETTSSKIKKNKKREKAIDSEVR